MKAALPLALKPDPTTNTLPLSIATASAIQRGARALRMYG
jgi:hypothetical protein